MNRLLALFLVSLSICQAVAASEAPPTLKVLSFNTWMLEILGIPLAKDIPLRRGLIVNEIKRLDPDVVNLIEVWESKEANYFALALKDKYPYCSFAPHAKLATKLYSNGLLLLSKYPLESDGKMLSPSGCTEPKDVLRFSKSSRTDERLVVNKGALHNVVIHPSLGRIDIYSAHLGALTYDVKTSDYTPKHKAIVLRQERELLWFMHDTRETSTQILGIDTNRNFRSWDAKTKSYSHRLDITYSDFLRFKLKDSYMAANGIDPTQVSNLYTFDEKKNPYVSGGHFSAAPSEFDDYIWVRSKTLSIESSEFVFNHPFAAGGKKIMASDHFGILTELRALND